MKSTGIVRKVDGLGRIVIPKETRKVLNINEEDPLEIYTDGETIILKKYNPGCNCCNNLEIAATVKGISLCKDCLDKFQKASKMLGLEDGINE